MQWLFRNSDKAIVPKQPSLTVVQQRNDDASTLQL